MATNEFSILNIGGDSYSVKDKTARAEADTADKNAQTAMQSVSTLKTKLKTSKLKGTYTSDTETLEVSLNIITD